MNLEEDAERLRSSTDCDPEGRQRCDVPRTEMCGNLWQRIPLTMVARDPETKLNNHTVLSSTGKRPVEIERSRHGSMMMHAGHTAAEPPLGMLDVQKNVRTQSGRVRFDL